jgi:putative peptidoglycan lipid II flippase
MSIFGGSNHLPSIEGVSFSVVLAAIIMVVIQIPAVIKTGFKFKWGINWKHEGVIKVALLFLPVMIGMALYQINLMMLPLVMGAKYGLPAVTDIKAANRLILLPLGLFGIAISTAAFPTLAQQVALNQFTEFRKTIAQSLKIILLLSVPSSAALFVLATPITYLLWGGGKFGELGAQASAFVLVFFAWSLIGLGVSNITARAFYAMHKSLIPALTSVLMVISSYFLAKWMSDSTELKYASVALATTITSIFSTIVLTDILRRKINGINGGDILKTTLKILLSTFIMSVVMYVVAYKLAPTTPLFGLIITKFSWNAPSIPFSRELAQVANTHIPHHQIFVQVLAACLSGILSYGVMLKLLRVQEFETVLQKIISKIKKSK